MMLHAGTPLPRALSRGSSVLAHAGTAESSGLHRLDIPGQEPGDQRGAISVAVPCLMLLMFVGTIACTTLFSLSPQARIQAHHTTQLPVVRHTRSRSLLVAYNTTSDSDLVWCSTSNGRYRLKSGETCSTVAGKPCKVPSLHTAWHITSFNDNLAGMETNVCSTPLALICYPPPPPSSSSC